MDLQNPIFTDENAAREALEAVRWPSGPVCPDRANKGPPFDLGDAGNVTGLRSAYR